MGKCLKTLKIEAFVAPKSKQRAVWCEWSFLYPVYVFNLGFLWFGCCLFLPHHMPTESHRHNLIFSYSVEQILGEERKLDHIATSETMTSKNRYFFFFSSSVIWFKSKIHRNLLNESNAEGKFVVALHRHLPSFWSAGLPPPVPLLLINRRSRWWDAESSLPPFSGTECCFFFVLSSALNLCFLLLLTPDLILHDQMT